jgi:RimJ/RimL family protein N-acetyltransferase
MLRTTPRLILRQPDGADLAALFAIYGDPLTNQFNPAGPLADIGKAAVLLHGWRTQWQDQGHGAWAIATCAAPEHVIGFGGLTVHQYLDVPRLNLGYRFAHGAWGHGYATELARAALDFGFDELRAQHIFALVRPAHVASIRVLEKAGMRRVDTLDDVPAQAPSLVFRSGRPL